jgi:hypothetical protein
MASAIVVCMYKHPAKAVAMAKLLSEQRIALTDLARRENVHLSTCWRWCLRGCKGHVLESFSVGGKKFTTIPAFERWLAAINGERVVGGETPHQRERAIDRAERKADELGV